MPVEPKSSYRFIIEILICGILLFTGLMWIAPGPLFPLIMPDYSVDRATVGLTTSIISLIMGISAIPAGIFANRFGLKRTIAIGIFLMAAGALTPLCSNIVQLLATRVSIAIGVAMAFPIAAGMVMQWFSGRELPLVNGINVSMMTIGNVMALFLSIPLATILGWKATLSLYGAVIFLLAIVWSFLGREHKSYATESGKDAPVTSISIGSVLKRKTTWLLGFTVSGPFILFMAISSWLPTYYNEVLGMPLSRASSITGLFPLFGILACIVGGLLPMRTGLRKPFLVAPGVILGLAALGTFLTSNMLIIYVSVALFGICELIFMPSVFTMVMELPGTNPKVAAFTMAAVLAVGNVAGSTGPLIVGFLADLSGSYLPGLIVCSALSLSLFFGGIFLPETGPRARQQAPL